VRNIKKPLAVVIRPSLPVADFRIFSNTEKSLLRPRHTEAMNDYDISDPTPQDWGFPDNPTRANIECWTRQEAFLEAYKLTSRSSHAAKAAGVGVHAVSRWVSRDVYQFKKRMELARQVYADSIRQIIHERLSNPQGNRGSDILLMFEAKAVMPEMYREEVKVLNVSAPIQMLERLRELATKERREQEALAPPAVEGEFKEVAPDGGEEVPMGANPGSLPTPLDSPSPTPPVSMRAEPPEPPKRPGRWQQKQWRQVKRR
jgi:hypothetical protein